MPLQLGTLLQKCVSEPCQNGVVHKDIHVGQMNSLPRNVAPKIQRQFRVDRFYSSFQSRSWHCAVECPIPHRGFCWHQTCMYSQTGGPFSFRLTDRGELLTEDNLSLPQPESSMPESVPDPLGKAHLDLVQ